MWWHHTRQAGANYSTVEQTDKRTCYVLFDSKAGQARVYAVQYSIADCCWYENGLPAGLMRELVSVKALSHWSGAAVRTATATNTAAITLASSQILHNTDLGRVSLPLHPPSHCTAARQEKEESARKLSSGKTVTKPSFCKQLHS